MGEIASSSQLRMSFLRWALVTVPLISLFGAVSGLLSGSGEGNRWYAMLVRPEFMPPGKAFGIVWPILYILLGLALAHILNARGAKGRNTAIGLFVGQLLLNYAWSPLFFAAHQVTAAFYLLLVIFALSVAAMLAFYRIRKVAGLLMLPYLAWLSFAAVLAFETDRLNPNAEQLKPNLPAAQVAL